MKKVFFRGRQDKIEVIAPVLQSYLNDDVLDVGCDEKFIKKFAQKSYVGVDIKGSPDIILNAEKGLPFKDKLFDTVIGFDVLEHIDSLHFLFDEMCRVAKHHVIIGLPNMYEWRFRLRYLLGKPISGKYGLSVDVPSGRHRWLFSLKNGREFVELRGKKNGFLVIDEIFGYFQYRKIFGRAINYLGYLLGSGTAPLFVYHICSVLEREL